MEVCRNHEPADAVTNALILMRRALAILDEADCPADVGAHLDLASIRLERWMLGGAVRVEPVHFDEQSLATGTYA